MSSANELRKLANSLRRSFNSRTAKNVKSYSEDVERPELATEEQKRFNSYIQWTTPDGDTFFPAGHVSKQLPPGYYDLGQTMQGEVFFKRKSVKAEKLIRFPDSASDEVIANIEDFWNLESEFALEELPYRRGIVLYGPPGSGKTCVLRIVIDNLVNKHAGIVIDFPNPQLFEAGYRILRQIHADMPLVVLMEDLDSILDRYMESEVLNLLDGVTDIRKAVFLATTNYPEKLGSRILNRPSRFDRKHFIGMPSREAREAYICTKLSDNSEIQRWVVDTDGLSIAHIKELFIANKIFGEEYNTALNVVKEMVSTPSSELFDDYQVIKGKTNWDIFGSGRIYAQAKKAFSRR